MYIVLHQSMMLEHKKEGQSGGIQLITKEEQEEEEEEENNNSRPEQEESQIMDKLSNLPDCILQAHVLPLLPIKSAAATSALSTRWRYLWTSTDLNLDDSCLTRAETSTAHWSDEQLWRFNAISQIISVHTGPIRRFVLTGFYYKTVPDSASILDGWISTVVERGVQEFVVRNNGLAEEGHMLPHSLLNCESLKILDLGAFRLPGPPLLPNVREIKLRRIPMVDEMVEDLLKGCEVLERLELVGCPGIRRLEIRSLCLRTLVVETWLSKELEDVVVADAPVLERLVVDHCLTTVTPVRILNAPKLELLSFVHVEIKHLQIAANHFKIALPDKALNYVASPIHNLRKLAIKVNFNNHDHAKMVVSLLKCFPCLETLVVQIIDMDRSSTTHVNFWDEQPSLDCLDLHLKNVTVRSFIGHRTDAGFARFLITKAQRLRKLTLLCGKSWSPDWVEIKKTQICINNKVSVDAEIVLKKDYIQPDEFLSLILSCE